jgi:RNA polymerase sigma-70 factor (ECF subfamily)
VDYALVKPLTMPPTTPSPDAGPAAPVTTASGATSLEERALVEACRRGERAALHTFYERYRRRVFSLIARIVGTQDAEELSQEVFVRAFRALDKFRGDAQLSTWMYRLAVNAALSHATRIQARRRRDLGDEVLHALPAEDAPEGDPRLRQRLQTALGVLPAGYRAVLVLHDVEGLQHEEIAQILGCRVGTSKSQLHKARLRMRQLLGGAP